MEVMKPQLIWIDKRCYRKNPLKGSQASNPEYEELVVSDNQIYCDEACDVDWDVEETSKGLRLKFEVPSAFYKYIIGRRGETKARIQMETHTQIHVPKPGDKQQFIVIDGHDKKGIVSAKTRMDVIIDSARQKEQFTHFLSLPINSDEVVMSFEEFKFKVLTECDGDRGLDSSLFQNARKLHLTIGTLVLLNDREIEKAASLLQSCHSEINNLVLQGHRLEVQVRGLEYMNDDPGAVDVLYAQIEPGPACDRLQSLADRLVDKFTAADLMTREHEHVKLHVTVMNTLMRKDPTGTSLPKTDTFNRRGSRPRESFDASNVLRKFEDFNFGLQHVSSIHLSQRFSTGHDDYYECVRAVALP